jgi:hypothetical protein
MDDRERRLVANVFDAFDDLVTAEEALAESQTEVLDRIAKGESIDAAEISARRSSVVERLGAMRVLGEEVGRLRQQLGI